MFIDGLDEFKDPHDTLDSLVDHLNLLQDLGNIKVCVSSRPELELVNRFQGLKQLRFQDLNYNDIKSFVHQSFVKTNLSEHDRTKLVNEVVWRAEGVFLWASLVTRSLVQGSKAYDDRDIMQARLNSLPRDMNKLFEQMLSDVDDVYWESLALYVQLMMLSIRDSQLEAITRIPIIAMLQLKKPINSYEEFANECERKVTQIESRTSGLLQVYKHRFYMHGRDWWDRATEPRFVNDQPCFKAHFTPKVQRLSRRRCGKNDPYPVMLDYEQKYMGWIHRSAFEFFTVLDEKSAVLYKSSLRREELLGRISDGLISYIEAAPKFDYPPRSMCNFSTPCVAAVSLWHDDNPAISSALLDKLYSTHLQLDPDEFDSSAIIVDIDSEIHAGEIIFWIECAFANLWSYILSRISHILKETTSDSVIVNLLASLMTQAAGFDITDIDSFTRLVVSLAEIVLQRMTKAYQVGDAMQTSGSTCFRRIIPLKGLLGREVCFDRASWREPVSGGSTTIMAGLVYILHLYIGVKWNASPRPELPGFLITLMEVTDLYAAPPLNLQKIHVQISAKDWTKFSDRSTTKGTIGNYVSAASLDRPIRIMCTPSNTTARISDGSHGAAELSP